MIKVLPLGEKFPISIYAGVVPMALEGEQLALNENIKENGLVDPIWIWRGEIVDGRCRQKGCLASDTQIKYRELDSNLTEKEVITFVKSVNTRRNLTMTQKVITASKEYLRRKADKEKVTQKQVATSWDVSTRILTYALFINKVRPQMYEDLFNGKTIRIFNLKGKEINTSRITTLFEIVKALDEQVEEDKSNTFDPASRIDSIEGRKWFFERISLIEKSKGSIMEDLAELANFKFPVSKTDSFNQETGEVL